MKYIVVAGARPNFMKIAPILRAFRDRRAGDVLLVHTGQHYDRAMSGDFFTDLEIPEPDINLGIGSGSHALQTGRVMISFEEVCLEQRPDWVIVVGDVNSTLACSLAAKKLGIGVAHVEAGLRSRDMTMPEEINRICTDAISDLLFTTDRMADANLAREGVEPGKIRFVGNTMIDTLLRHIECARSTPLPAGLEDGHYAVLTLHRPANVDTDEALQGIMDAAAAVAERIPVFFPAHPRTAGRLSRIRLHPNVRVAQPVSYLPFVGIVARARLVLTDSGGIQEETTVLGVPCITMRNSTERPITCEVGTNILAGTDPERIRHFALEILDQPPQAGRIPELWDGKAAQRIVDILLASPSPAVENHGHQG